MEWMSDYLPLSVVVAVVLIGVPVYYHWKNRPDPTKKKFVVAGTAGCMGCVMAVSLISGIISAVLSIIASIHKLFS
jgi:hypothetical protein